MKSLDEADDDIDVGVNEGSKGRGIRHAGCKGFGDVKQSTRIWGNSSRWPSNSDQFGHTLRAAAWNRSRSLYIPAILNVLLSYCIVKRGVHDIVK